MAGLQFTDLRSRPTVCLDFTSLIVDELQSLVPAFEAVFQVPMTAWRRQGNPGPPAGFLYTILA
jgi:hypothetical protein